MSTEGEPSEKNGDITKVCGYSDCQTSIPEDPAAGWLSVRLMLLADETDMPSISQFLVCPTCVPKLIESTKMSLPTTIYERG